MGALDHDAELENCRMIAFGPVPSRRLGRSMGINNIPPKVCTYSCIYCQLGRTIRMQAERQAFFEPAGIFSAVQAKVARVEESGKTTDALTFVPDGEPTLDVHLGQEIESLKPLHIKTAVITNGSLAWRQDVREDLMGADWVSLKVDAVQEEVWRHIGRPHRSLSLTRVLDGMLGFAEAYRGELVTETMLVQGVNDGKDHVREVAQFLAHLQPQKAYVSIPIRPPAEQWVHAPAEDTINQAYQLLSERLETVEVLIGYEGNAFAFTGDVEGDLLSITAVHPMRQEAVSAFLRRAGAGWEVVARMVAQGQLVEAEFQGHLFYLRKLRGQDGGRPSAAQRGDSSMEGTHGFCS